MRSVFVRSGTIVRRVRFSGFARRPEPGHACNGNGVDCPAVCKVYTRLTTVSSTQVGWPPTYSVCEPAMIDVCWLYGFPFPSLRESYDHISTVNDTCETSSGTFTLSRCPAYESRVT